MAEKKKRKKKQHRLVISESNLKKAVDATNDEDWVGEMDIDFLTVTTAEVFLKKLGITVIRRRKKYHA